MRYMTNTEIQEAEVGVTGITKVINGIVFEKVENNNGFGWTVWDNVDRSGMRASVNYNEAIELGLIER